MSVRPESLATNEGELISISIAVEASALESLLEALACVTFPINPQIYHDAAVVSRFPDGHEEASATTLVEFPAYESGLDEVATAIERFGFDPSMIEVTGMLQEIQSGGFAMAGPAAQPTVSRYRVQHYPSRTTRPW